MDNSAFFSLIFLNLYTYIMGLVLSLVFYYVIFRNHVVSIADPFFLAFVTSAIGFNTTIFLYIEDQITIDLLISYLLTQCAFILGFLLAGYFWKKKAFSRRVQVNGAPIKEGVNVRYFYLVCLLSFLFFFILQSTLFGLPIFIELEGGSRLESYVGGSLFGYLNKITSTLYVVILASGTYVLIRQPNMSSGKRLMIYFGFVVVFLYLLSLGSKSFFIKIIFIIFAVIYFAQPYQNQAFKRLNKYILLAIVFVLGMIWLKSDEPIFYFLYRLVLSGDAYYMSYPNEVFRIVDELNWFVATFNGVLNNFGLLSESEKLVPVGYQLYQNFYPVEFVGPNPRHNVFGLIFYGEYFSVVYSFILGLTLGIVRYYFILKTSLNLFTTIMFVLLLLAAIRLEADVALAISGFLNATILFPIIYFVFYIFLKSLNIKAKQ